MSLLKCRTGFSITRHSSSSHQSAFGLFHRELLKSFPSSPRRCRSLADCWLAPFQALIVVRVLEKFFLIGFDLLPRTHVKSPPNVLNWQVHRHFALSLKDCFVTSRFGGLWLYTGVVIQITLSDACNLLHTTSLSTKFR